MAASVIRMNLSSSTNGKAIPITTNVPLGNLIHTATASATPGAGGTWDEIYLWVCSTLFSVKVSVEFGDSTAPDHEIVSIFRGRAGQQILLSGLILQNGQLVRVYSSIACSVTGFVNRVTN